MKSLFDRIRFKTGRWGVGVAVTALASYVIFIGPNQGCTDNQSNPTTVSEGKNSGDAGAKTASTHPESGPAPTVENSKASAGRDLARIVFITTSQACPCTMERCQSGEEALNAALAKHPGAPAMERIDLDQDRERATELTNQYPAAMLPVVYFLAQDGTLLDKLEGDFFEEDVNRGLEKSAAGAR